MRHGTIQYFLNLGENLRVLGEKNVNKKIRKYKKRSKKKKKKKVK
jgi:hypothetical protein